MFVDVCCSLLFMVVRWCGWCVSRVVGCVVCCRCVLLLFVVGGVVGTCMLLLVLFGVMCCWLFVVCCMLMVVVVFYRSLCLAVWCCRVLCIVRCC